MITGFVVWLLDGYMVIGFVIWLRAWLYGY